ncbi:MAG: hypothetical protein WDA22_02405 [Bacteroidota bacterium]
MYVITENSTIEFMDLIHRNDDGEIIVGNKQQSSYVVIDSIGYESLKLFSEGLTVRGVKNRLKLKYSNETEDIVIKDFLETFIEAGLIKRINGIEVLIKHSENISFRIPFSVKTAKILCSTYAIFIYVMFIIASGYLVLYNPQIRPTFSDFFVFDRLFLLLIFMTLTGWLMTLFHEMGHLIAAKSLEIDANVQLSSRLFFTVAQTTVTNLWSIPRNKRSQVYIAGMLVDLLIISVIVVTIYLFEIIENIPSSMLGVLLRIVMSMQLMKIASQLLIILRSDFYYIIANWSNSNDLYSESISLLKNIAIHIRKGKLPFDHELFTHQYSQRQKVIVVMFSIALLINWLIVAIIFVLFIIPSLYNLVMNIIVPVISSGKITDPLFDTLLLFILVAINLILPIKQLLNKKYKQKTNIVCDVI